MNYDKRFQTTKPYPFLSEHTRTEIAKRRAAALRADADGKPVNLPSGERAPRWEDLKVDPDDLDFE